MSKERYQWYMGTSEIIDNKTKKFITQDCPKLLNKQSKHIADLEEKLAEKEERINWLVEAEFNREWAKKYVEMRRKEDPMLCLPDSDEVYERYFELKQQLAEKEKQIEVQKDNIQFLYDLFISPKGEQTLKTIHQDKISFAVEQLEKVKEWIFNSVKKYSHLFEDDLLEEIDNQIKQLKEGK